MLRSTVALAVAFSAGSIALGAQQQGALTTPITALSGCLQGARADITTANAKGVIYTLEAVMEKLPTSPAPEGSGPVKPSSRRYALSFAESVDLSKHVNQHVEVRGRAWPRAEAEPTRAEQSTAKPLPGAAQQMFHVIEITMISPTCK